METMIGSIKKDQATKQLIKEHFYGIFRAEMAGADFFSEEDQQRSR